MANWRDQFDGFCNGRLATVLSKPPYRGFDTQLIFNQVEEKLFESYSYKSSKT